MEAVVEPGNLKKALARVRRNKGAPGVDGMTVDELGDHLKAHWPEIRMLGDWLVNSSSGAVNALFPTAQDTRSTRTPH